MKELSIEEKAKAYDRALEIAKAWCKIDNNDLSNDDLETIFPELKESEEERIRKEIIEYIKTGTYHKDWLAWLEKQSDKHLINFDEAEKEKNDFVSGQFIECRKSFNEFKEHNSYWLEYLGDDDYIGRSDNILNQKFHITPRQLFTLFTQQHCPKEDNTNEETNASTGYGKYIDECLNEAAKHFFSEGEDTYSVADLFYAGVRCGKSLFEKQGEQKVDYTTLVETGNGGINALITKELPTNGCDDEKKPTDKVEPKFKVGDWIIFNGLVLHIDEVVDGYYRTISKGGIPNSYDWNIDNVARLWTIQDWKPSDEQIKALHDLNLIGNISYAGQGQVLIELYNDLKKLKGE